MNYEIWNWLLGVLLVGLSGVAYAASPTVATDLFVDGSDAQSGTQGDPVVDIDLTPVFSAVFNHPTGTETTTEAKFQVATDAAFSNTVWSQGWKTVTSTAVGARSSDVAYSGSSLATYTLYYWRVRFKDSQGNAGPWSTESASFRTIGHPAEATDLYVDSANAQIGTQGDPVTNVDLTPVFSAVFDHEDSAASTTEAQFQVATDTTFTNTVWSQGYKTIASTSAGGRSPDVGYSGQSLASFTTYYWRVRFKDSAGNDGPWSTESASFRTIGNPTEATTLYIDNSDSQGGSQGNPVTGIDLSPVFSAVFNHEDSAATTTEVQFQVATDTAFTNTVWSQGYKTIATTTAGSRSPDVAYAGQSLTSFTTYYWRVRFKDSAGNDGPWSTESVSFRTVGHTLLATNLFVDGANAQAGSQGNPVTGIDLTPVFSAIFNHEDSATTTTEVKFQVATDAAFNNTVWSQGWKAIASTTAGARSPDFAYGGQALTSNTTYYWRVRFRDAQGNAGGWSTEAASFTTLGSGTNTPPTLQPVNDVWVAEGKPLTIQLVGNDEDVGDTLTYGAALYAITSLPTGATLDTNLGVLHWTPDYTQQGEYPFLFSVSDDGSPSLSDEQLVRVSVLNVNRPPVIGVTPSGDKQIFEGDTLSLSLSVSDPDTSDTLTVDVEELLAAMLPSGAVLDTNLLTFTWTPTFDQAGDYLFRFSVRDGGAPELLDSVDIAVEVQNLPVEPYELFVDSHTAQGGTRCDPVTGIDLTPVFSARFQSLHTSVSGVAAQIEVSSDAQFLNTVWLSSELTLTQSVAIDGRSEDVAYVGPTLSRNTRYYWRIRFRDSAANLGEWSNESASFKTISGPTEARLLFSGSTQAQTGTDGNPVIGLTRTPVFSGIFGHPRSAAVGTSAEIQVSVDATFTVVTHWDSGPLSTSLSDGDRTQDVSYAGSPLQDGTQYYWRMRFTDAEGLVGLWPATSASFVVGTYPSPPSMLFVDSADAQHGSTGNPVTGIDTTPVFSALFNHPVALVSTVSARVQVTTDSLFNSVTHWNSEILPLARTLANNRCPNINYGGSTLSPGTTYYWRILFFDSSNLSSDWSTEVVPFETSHAPKAPTGLFINDVDAQGGDPSPAQVITATPKFSALHEHTSASDAVEARVQVSTDSLFSHLSHWDSGWIGIASVSDGTRSNDIQYSGTNLEGATQYFWRIRFKDAAGASGDWSQSAEFDALARPLEPTQLEVGNGGSGSSGNPVTGISQAGIEFSAIYEHEATEAAGLAQVEISTFPSFATSLWDSGLVPLANPTTPGQRSDPANYVGPNLFDGIRYYWRIRFEDSQGILGPWSSTTASFELIETPAEAHTLHVSDTNAQTGFSGDPVSEINSSPVVSAVAVHSDGVSNLTAWQVQLSLSSSFSAIVSDSGMQAMTATPSGQRTPDLSPNFTLSPGRYFWRIRTSDGLAIGPWSSETASFVVPTTILSTISNFPYAPAAEDQAQDFVANFGSGPSASGSRITHAQLTSPRAGSPTGDQQAWAILPNAGFATSTVTWLHSPVFDISSGTQPLELRFELWANGTSGEDGIKLQSSVDSGQTWQDVTPSATGYTGNTNSSNALSSAFGGGDDCWTNVSLNGNGQTVAIDLAPYASQSDVRFRWAFAAGATSGGQGMVIDSPRIAPPNSPPMFVNLPASITLNEGELFQMTLDAVDPDAGSEISFDVAEVNGNPMPPGTSLVGNVFSWLVGYNQQAQYEFVFTATDNENPGALVSNSVTFDVLGSLFSVAGIFPPSGSHTAATNTDIRITFQGVPAATGAGIRVHTARGDTPFTVAVNGNDLVINPNMPFLHGEEVEVTVAPPLTTAFDSTPLVESVTWKFAVGAAGGSGTFSEWPVLADPLAAAGRAVAAPDINRDGYADLVIGVDPPFGQQDVDRVYLFDSATRSYLPLTTLQGPTGAKTTDVEAGDFDRDGFIDLLFVRENGGVTVYVYDPAAMSYPANGQLIAPASDNVTGADVGDIDGDGWLDVAFARGNAGTPAEPYVLLSSGGSILSGTTPTLLQGFQLAGTAVLLADQNLDGFLDVIVGSEALLNSNPPSGECSFVYLNKLPVGGLFDPALPFGRLEGIVSGISSADFDNDGFPDLVIAYQDGGAYYPYDFSPQGVASYLPGVGNPPLFFSESATAIAAGDFDDDGNVDLAVGFPVGGGRIFTGDGQGMFVSAGTFGPANSRIESLVPVDVDGDGDLDLVSASRTNSRNPIVNQQFFNEIGLPTIVPTLGGPTHGSTITPGQHVVWGTWDSTTLDLPHAIEIVISGAGGTFRPAVEISPYGTFQTEDAVNFKTGLFQIVVNATSSAGIIRTDSVTIDATAPGTTNTGTVVGFEIDLQPTRPEFRVAAGEVINLSIKAIDSQGQQVLRFTTQEGEMVTVQGTGTAGALPADLEFGSAALGLRVLPGVVFERAGEHLLDARASVRLGLGGSRLITVDPEDAISLSENTPQGTDFVASSVVATQITFTATDPYGNGVSTATPYSGPASKSEVVLTLSQGTFFGAGPTVSLQTDTNGQVVVPAILMPVANTNFTLLAEMNGGSLTKLLNLRALPPAPPACGLSIVGVTTDSADIEFEIGDTPADSYQIYLNGRPSGFISGFSVSPNQLLQRQLVGLGENQELFVEVESVATGSAPTRVSTEGATLVHDPVPNDLTISPQTETDIVVSVLPFPGLGQGASAALIERSTTATFDPGTFVSLPTVTNIDQARFVDELPPSLALTPVWYRLTLQNRKGIKSAHLVFGPHTTLPDVEMVVQVPPLYALTAAPPSVASSEDIEVSLTLNGNPISGADVTFTRLGDGSSGEPYLELNDFASAPPQLDVDDVVRTTGLNGVAIFGPSTNLDVIGGTIAGNAMFQVESTITVAGLPFTYRVGPLSIPVAEGELLIQHIRLEHTGPNPSAAPVTPTLPDHVDLFEPQAQANSMLGMMSADISVGPEPFKLTGLLTAQLSSLPAREWKLSMEFRNLTDPNLTVDIDGSGRPYTTYTVISPAGQADVDLPLDSSVRFPNADSLYEVLFVLRTDPALEKPVFILAGRLRVQADPNGPDLATERIAALVVEDGDFQLGASGSPGAYGSGAALKPLRVKAVDKNGNPVPGATIAFRGGAALGSKVTDVAGRGSLDYQRLEDNYFATTSIGQSIQGRQNAVGTSSLLAASFAEDAQSLAQGASDLVLISGGTIGATGSAPSYVVNFANCVEDGESVDISEISGGLLERHEHSVAWWGRETTTSTVIDRFLVFGGRHPSSGTYQAPTVVEIHRDPNNEMKMFQAASLAVNVSPTGLAAALLRSHAAAQPFMDGNGRYGVIVWGGDATGIPICVFITQGANPTDLIVEDMLPGITNPGNSTPASLVVLPPNAVDQNWTYSGAAPQNQALNTERLLLILEPGTADLITARPFQATGLGAELPFAGNLALHLSPQTTQIALAATGGAQPPAPPPTPPFAQRFFLAGAGGGRFVAVPLSFRTPVPGTQPNNEPLSENYADGPTRLVTTSRLTPQAGSFLANGWTLESGASYETQAQATPDDAGAASALLLTPESVVSFEASDPDFGTTAWPSDRISGFSARETESSGEEIFVNVRRGFYTSHSAISDLRRPAGEVFVADAVNLEYAMVNAARVNFVSGQGLTLDPQTFTSQLSSTPLPDVRSTVFATTDGNGIAASWIPVMPAVAGNFRVLATPSDGGFDVQAIFSLAARDDCSAYFSPNISPVVYEDSQLPFPTPSAGEPEDPCAIDMVIKSNCHGVSFGEKTNLLDTVDLSVLPSWDRFRRNIQVLEPNLSSFPLVDAETNPSIYDNRDFPGKRLDDLRCPQTVITGVSMDPEHWRCYSPLVVPFLGNENWRAAAEPIPFPDENPVMTVIELRRVAGTTGMGYFKDVCLSICEGLLPDTYPKRSGKPGLYEDFVTIELNKPIVERTTTKNAVQVPTPPPPAPQTPHPLFQVEDESAGPFPIWHIRTEESYTIAIMGIEADISAFTATIIADEASDVPMNIHVRAWVEAWKFKDLRKTPPGGSPPPPEPNATADSFTNPSGKAYESWVCDYLQKGGMGPGNRKVAVLPKQVIRPCDGQEYDGYPGWFVGPRHYSANTWPAPMPGTSEYRRLAIYWPTTFFDMEGYVFEPTSKKDDKFYPFEDRVNVNIPEQIRQATLAKYTKCPEDEDRARPIIDRVVLADPNCPSPYVLEFLGPPGSKRDYVLAYNSQRIDLLYEDGTEPVKFTSIPANSDLQARYGPGIAYVSGVIEANKPICFKMIGVAPSRAVDDGTLDLFWVDHQHQPKPKFRLAHCDAVTVLGLSARIYETEAPDDDVVLVEKVNDNTTTPGDHNGRKAPNPSGIGGKWERPAAADREQVDLFGQKNSAGWIAVNPTNEVATTRTRLDITVYGPPEAMEVEIQNKSSRLRIMGTEQSEVTGATPNPFPGQLHDFEVVRFCVCPDDATGEARVPLWLKGLDYSTVLCGEEIRIGPPKLASGDKSKTEPPASQLVIDFSPTGGGLSSGGICDVECKPPTGAISTTGLPPRDDENKDDGHSFVPAPDCPSSCSLVLRATVFEVKAMICNESADTDFGKEQESDYLFLAGGGTPPSQGTYYTTYLLGPIADAVFTNDKESPPCVISDTVELEHEYMAAAPRATIQQTSSGPKSLTLLDVVRPQMQEPSAFRTELIPTNVSTDEDDGYYRVKFILPGKASNPLIGDWEAFTVMEAGIVVNGTMASDDDLVIGGLDHEAVVSVSLTPALANPAKALSNLQIGVPTGGNSVWSSVSQTANDGDIAADGNTAQLVRMENRSDLMQGQAWDDFVFPHYGVRFRGVSNQKDDIELQLEYACFDPGASDITRPPLTTAPASGHGAVSLATVKLTSTQLVMTAHDICASNPMSGEAQVIFVAPPNVPALDVNVKVDDADTGVNAVVGTSTTTVTVPRSDIAGPLQIASVPFQPGSQLGGFRARVWIDDLGELDQQLSTIDPGDTIAQLPDQMLDPERKGLFGWALGSEPEEVRYYNFDLQPDADPTPILNEGRSGQLVLRIVPEEAAADFGAEDVTIRPEPNASGAQPDDPDYWGFDTDYKVETTKNPVAIVGPPIEYASQKSENDTFVINLRGLNPNVGNAATGQPLPKVTWTAIREITLFNSSSMLCEATTSFAILGPDQGPNSLVCKYAHASPDLNVGERPGTAYGDDQDGGDPVQLDRGDLTVSRADLEIQGRGFNFIHSRTYRARSYSDTPQGRYWDFGYNQRLDIEEAGNVSLVEAFKSRTERYAYDPVTKRFTTPNQYFVEMVRFDNNTPLNYGDDSYRIIDNNGMVTWFNSRGLLELRMDRFGNQMNFLYEDVTRPTRLTAVVETMGRRIEYSYYPDNDSVVGRRGRLHQVTDFAGRVVTYDYDTAGRLISATTPVVVGTSTGNDFAQGKTERYEYQSFPLDFKRDSLLSAIIQPREAAGSQAPTFVFEYDSEGRVERQQWGDATQVITYTYTNDTLSATSTRTAAVKKTTVADRNGNICEYFFSNLGQIVEQREHGAGGPFIKQYRFDAQNQMKRITYPEGDSVEFIYDDGLVDLGGGAYVIEPRLRSNTIEERRNPGPRGGDQSVRITRYVVEPFYNSTCVVIDPRGHETSNNLAYATRTYFDWEEGDNREALANYLLPHLDSTPGSGAGWNYVNALLNRMKGQGMALGLAPTDNVPAVGIAVGSDLNADGETDRISGSKVRTLLPAVTLTTEQMNALGVSTAEQYVSLAYFTNQFGQRTATIDPAGNITVIEYHATNNPTSHTGGPSPLVVRDDNSISGGLTHSVIRDASNSQAAAKIVVARHSPVLTDVPLGSLTSPIPRTSTATATDITSTMTHDVVGNMLSETDPRGATTTFEVNALDQVVKITVPQPYGYSVEYIYDENNNVTETRVDNFVATLDGQGRLQLNQSGSFTNVDTAQASTAQFVHRNSYNILNDLTQTEIDASSSLGAFVLITKYFYDANQNLTTVILPEGNLIKNTYASRDVLLTSTHGDGTPEATTTTFEYDGALNITRILDGTGDASDSVFDGYNRLVQTTDAEGNVVHLTWDPASNMLSTRLVGPVSGQTGAPVSDLYRSTVTYDPLSRPIEVREDLFDEAGNPIATGGASANLPYVRTARAFDELSRVGAVIQDNGGVRSVSYDGANRPVVSTDAVGNTVQFTYDQNSNVTETRETHLATDGATLPETYTTKVEYDVLNRPTRVTDNLFNITNYAYDSRDNQTHSTDALFNTSVSVFDGASRMIESIRNMRGTGSSHITDDAINTKYQYDLNSRLVAVQDDSVNTTLYTYDAVDRVLTTQYANGETESVTYDADSNVLTSTDQNGTVITNTYDKLNRLLTRSIAAANPVTTERAGTTQIIGTTAQTFEYDGASRLTKATDNNDPSDPNDDAECTYVYDSLNRVRSEAQTYGAQTFTVDYGWESEARMKTSAYENTNTSTTTNTITRNFDALDRVIDQDWSSTSYGSTPYTQTYIGAGRPLKRTVRGVITRDFHVPGSTTVSGYDGLMRPTYLNYGAGELAIGWDAVSNQRFQHDSVSVSATNPRNLESYTYDAAYRLIDFDAGPGNNLTAAPSVTTLSGDSRITAQGLANPGPSGPSTRSVQWALDGVGSWLGLTEDGGTPAVNVTGDLNQYQQFGGQLLDHAPNGNTVEDAQTFGTANQIKYEYDGLNRLRKATLGAITIGEYDYDPSGRRVFRQADVDHDGTLETQVRYLFDGARVAQEFDGSNNLLREFVFGNYVDEPVWMRVHTGANAGEYLYGQDENFNVYALLDASGNALEQYRYDAYGAYQRYTFNGTNWVEAAGPSAFENPFYFQGRRLDVETNLLYFRARYYNPTTGRFISFDVLGYDAGSMNLYQFEGSSPLAQLDPDGQIAQLLVTVLGGAAIGGTVGFVGSLLSGEDTGTAAVRGVIGALSGAVGGLLAGVGVPLPFVGAISNAIDAALNKAFDIYKEATEKGCEVDWEELLEQAFLAGIQGAITGLVAGGLGSIAGKLLAKLNLCGKMGRLLNKAVCPGVQMATEMAVTEGASQAFNQGVDDAFVPDNCFVAGTPVWVLKDGVDAEQANEAIENGASWQDYAEQKPIEEVEAGDYALSRPEDNADGKLSFNLITETYTNTTEELVHLWVLDYATGAAEKLTTTPGHPFWVTTSSASSTEGTWEFAANLTAGDQLVDADGDTLTVASATSETRHEATYNFCVSEDHTYYVGDTTTWVHNTSNRENAAILRENLIREGRGPGPGQAAGHIVPSTGTQRQYKAAVRMRALLNKYNIGINDAANGIPIDHPRPHNETHKAKFLNNLEDRLNNVEKDMKSRGRGHKATRRALRNELRKVGNETPKKCN